MTKLIVRDYMADDFITTEANDVAKAEQFGQPVESWALSHETAGPAVTVLTPEGEIVFCFGVHHFWPGVGELWAVYAECAARHPMVLRYTQRFIEILWKQYGYRRLQAAVNPEFDVAIRSIEHLGFTREGVMRSYGPQGEDRILYALVREGGL